MKKYLEFLVKYTVQNVEFSGSLTWEAYHLDKILIPSSNKPLISIDVRIVKRKAKPNETKSPGMRRKKVEIEAEYVRVVDM